MTEREPDMGKLIGRLSRRLREELFHRLGEQGHPR